MVRTQNLSKFEIFSPSKLSIVQRNLFNSHNNSVTVFENHTKSLILQKSRAKNLQYLNFRGKKSLWIKTKMRHFWWFSNTMQSSPEIRRMKEENVIWKKCTSSSSSSSKLSLWSLVNCTKTFQVLLHAGYFIVLYHLLLLPIADCIKI